MHEKHSSIITYYTRLDTMYVLCSLRHDVSGFFFVSAPFHVRLDQKSCLVEDQSPAITHWERPMNNKADLFNFVLFEYNEESKYFDWLNRRPSSWRKSLTRQWMCLCCVFLPRVCSLYWQFMKTKHQKHWSRGSVFGWPIVHVIIEFMIYRYTYTSIFSVFW